MKMIMVIKFNSEGNGKKNWAGAQFYNYSQARK